MIGFRLVFTRGRTLIYELTCSVARAALDWRVVLVQASVPGFSPEKPAGAFPRGICKRKRSVSIPPIVIFFWGGGDAERGRTSRARNALRADERRARAARPSRRLAVERPKQLGAAKAYIHMPSRRQLLRRQGTSYNKHTRTNVHVVNRDAGVGQEWRGVRKRVVGMSLRPPGEACFLFVVRHWWPQRSPGTGLSRACSERFTAASGRRGRREKAS